MSVEYSESDYTFKYYNGAKEVHADPSDVYEKLLDDPEIDYLGEWSEVDMLEGDEQRQAIDRLVNHTRKVFNLLPLREDGLGLTRAQMAQVGRDFVDWVIKFKKKLLVSQTRWQTSESKSQEGNLEGSTD